MLFFFFFSCTATSTEVGLGRRVGGRREVKDVENNKDVQDLGRFCVQEYNRQKAANGSGSSSKQQQLLSFSRVVEAETQVVSGIKYYLKISASKATFDAVVIVKPWMHHHSMDLLSFTPSPPPTSNTK
ncbi:hypothetical protein BUALT_Bualt14G0026200 [Buddleja alternifolia]|uniref:Cystatin domain-containing protein n=1 Tax=Buddleja alternifolia TaxID=168488 RepID=A0AAV6WGC0_9LAMI|nr:hypothetical protein BUALT_Bualt14G0026200 [Buddleja alternifolia]